MRDEEAVKILAACKSVASKLQAADAYYRLTKQELRNFERFKQVWETGQAIDDEITRLAGVTLEELAILVGLMANVDWWV